MSNLEIEKKWLIDIAKMPDLLNDMPRKKMYQFYLPFTTNNMSVRFRLVEKKGLKKAYCTIKHTINNLVRKEFEHEIAVEAFDTLKEEYEIGRASCKERV